MNLGFLTNSDSSKMATTYCYRTHLDWVFVPLSIKCSSLSVS